jgi:hypothetical protein
MNVSPLRLGVQGQVFGVEFHPSILNIDEKWTSAIPVWSGHSWPLPLT